MSRTYRTSARKTGNDTLASRAYCGKGRAKCGVCSDRDHSGRARNGHIRATLAAQAVNEAWTNIGAATEAAHIERGHRVSPVGLYWADIREAARWDAIDLATR